MDILLLKSFFDKFNFKNNLLLKLGCKIAIFLNLTTLFEKLQKNLWCNFCDFTSISFIVISFHQIPLTRWNAYLCNVKWCDGLLSKEWINTSDKRPLHSLNMFVEAQAWVLFSGDYHLHLHFPTHAKFGSWNKPRYSKIALVFQLTQKSPTSTYIS